MIPLMSFGYTTFILLIFSRYFRNISNFVNKYSTITLCHMLVCRIPSYIIAEDGKPESISESIYRKLPCINSVALSNDTECWSFEYLYPILEDSRNWVLRSTRCPGSPITSQQTIICLWTDHLFFRI